MPEHVRKPGGCGCHLDPVDDTQTSSDLCSEATGMHDGVGWLIVLCPLHAAAPELLEALHAISIHLDQVPVGSKTGDHVDDAQSIARAAIRKATGG